MKRIICVLLVTVLIVSMLLSCSIPLRNSGEEINKKPAWNALFAAIQVFLYLQYIHIFHILLTHIRLVP